MPGFVCLYYGNTGSSWLLSALSGSPDVFAAGFESVEQWAWDVPSEERLAWLEKALSPPAQRSGPEFEDWLEAMSASPQFKQVPMHPNFALTCIKVSDLPVTDTAALIDVLDRTGAKAIHLVRDNRFKHALSLHRYHDEQKSQFHGKDEYSPTKVNFVKFEEWRRESERLHEQAMEVRQACIDQLGADRVFPLSYEEFTDEDGKLDVLNRLAEFLNIQADFGVGEFSKATPDSLRTAISNYPAFWFRYRFGPYARYLG